MPNPTRIARAAAAIAAFLIAAAAAPSAAHAQTCTPGSPDCDDGTGTGIDAPPVLHVHPLTANVAQPAMPVTISMLDNRDLEQSTFKVVRSVAGGPEEDVTSQFSFTRTPDEFNPVYKMKGTATGTVSLSASGPVRLRAYICDRALADRCAWSGTAVYRMALPGVAVGPDAQFFSVVHQSGPRTQPYTVANRGTDSAWFALSVECRDGAGDPRAGCGVQPRVMVAPGATATVNVTYPSNQLGAMSIVVTARHEVEEGVQDAGWSEATVRTMGSITGMAPMLVSPVPMNAGATIERSLCVTVATALRGAFECGDLRVVHALPAHRTYNRAWGPVLVYNSQHAHPAPTVYADVTLIGTEQLASVEVVVRRANGAVHRARFAGNSFLPDVPRRVGVTWNGGDMATGVHGYTLEVIAHYASASYPSAPVQGELAVVNRGRSPFGAGWWMAGWEQFVCVDCYSSVQRRLWVGGDGSTRVYSASDHGTTWTAQHPDGPVDSIIRQPDGHYVRTLPGGGKIWFNFAGEHVRTVNRLGQATVFTVQGSMLTGITVPVPPGGGTAPGWTLAYQNFGSGAWRLKTVTATAPGAPNRQVSISHATASDYRIGGITDPDAIGVSFGYAAGTYPERISWQVNRRKTPTFYGYDTRGKLNLARTQLGSAADAARDISMGFVAAESQGVAMDGSTTGTAVPAAVYTRVDGPRPAAEVVDHTYMWVGPDGTLRRIRNPVGAETRIRYGDGRFPALATEVTAPSGMYTRAWYDHEGRSIASTVFGQYSATESSTTYTGWDEVCDKPSMMTSPVADTTWITYDQATCNPLTQTLGRNPDRTVTYAYYPASHQHAGMVSSVTGPRDAAGDRATEQVEYDARGNLRLTRSPLGFVTLYEADALGRDTAVYTPIADDANARDPLLVRQYGARQSVRYNLAGLPETTVSYGPAIAHPAHDSRGPGTTVAEELTVETTYDDEGSPRTVTRTIYPNPAALQPQVTQYEYDGAGRKTDEYTNGLIHQHWEYDQGSNVVTVVTPRLARITSRYDAAGRLVRREVPETFTPQQSGSCPVTGAPNEPTCNLARFPFFPNSGTGYRTAAEWTTYRYDISGNMVRAENADAVVERTYFPNGQVWTDSTRIREFGRDNEFSKVFGIAYGYHEGRLTRLVHPGNLANTSGPADTDKFAYHPQTGALSAAEDRHGNFFGFNRDAAGRLTSIHMPGGVVDSMRYDREGRATWRRETSPHYFVPLQEETFAYDARGKVLAVTVPPTLDRNASTFVQWYSGLGNLAMTHWVNGSNPRWQGERFYPDPLGNVLGRHEFRPTAESFGNDHPDYRYSMDPELGRVDSVSLVDSAGFSGSTPPIDDSWFRYDMAGNQETTYQRSGSGSGFTHMVDTRSFYAADDRLRAFQKYDDRPASPQAITAGLFEEYRYDPLGRRVGVRTRRPVDICNQTEECYNSTTYFVWAGDQLLWELRSTDANDGGNTQGQVSYFQAGGIDRPLTIWKEGIGTIVTHQSWRGQFSRGTFGNGPRAGQSSDCTEYPATNGCLPVRWPGWNTTAWNQEAEKPATVGSERFWFGSLSVGMRDASGQLYMRNRYYNPQTGQFTQPDPIGLAGGLNSYGFAAGDPITFADPYGLAADTIEIDKELRPAMDECAQRSQTCRAFVDSAATSNGYYRVKLGEPGDCAPYEIGCFTPDSRGGTLTIIPGEFHLVNYPVNEGDVIGHEFAHAMKCGGDEGCAVQKEQTIRFERGRPPRVPPNGPLVPMNQHP